MPRPTALRWARLAALPALLLLLTIAPPASANSPSQDGAVIDNGVVQLGVNDWGNLNFFPGPGGVLSQQGNATVGLRFLRGGDPPLEATADGCTCEGWGVADASSTLSGFANDATGYFGLELVSFTRDADSATSVMRTTGEGSPSAPAPARAPRTPLASPPALEIEQAYRPSDRTDYLYEDVVTITNVGVVPVADLRYRRVMDWDIEPTAFSEFSTIDGADSANLLFSSDQGFDTADPLGPLGFFSMAQCSGTDGGGSDACTGFFNDAGPTDHGAHFDFGFGALAPGESTTFTVFYGAAPDEAAAIDAVHDAGGEVWSFGQANVENGPDLGVPATFIFAFSTSRSVDEDGPSPSMTLRAPGVSGVATDGAPLPFDVSAALHNFGRSAADALAVDLSLPAGLSLVSGDDPASLGSLAPGADTGATWRVQPEDKCADATYRIGASATWTGAASPLTAARTVIVHGSCGRVYGLLTGADRTGVHGLSGATVELCETDLTGCTSRTTSALGRYEFSDLTLAAGETSHDYKVIAHGSGSFTDPATQTSGTITVTRGSDNRRDFGWETIDRVDDDTTIGGPGVIGAGPVPTLYWSAETTLHQAACPPGTTSSSARFRVVNGDGSEEWVPWTAMTVQPDGSFVGTIPALHPNHGDGHVDIEVTCDTTVTPSGFDVYIDPSGVVRDTDGDPIAGATVTLYRYEGATLGYQTVPDGSAVMSPANRTNPDKTDAAGHFGWDVTAGNYVVRASKAGCHAPGSTTAYVETVTMTIPPPVTDIDLRLECDRPSSGGGSSSSGQALGSTTAPAPVAGALTTIGLPLGRSAARDTTKPRITGLRVTPRRFKSRFPYAKREKARIALTLSEPATTRLALERIVSGRRAGGTCKATGAAARSGPRCKRYVSISSLKRKLGAGGRRVAFGGFYRSGKRLIAGQYRITAVAKDAAGNTSAKRSTTFTILR